MYMWIEGRARGGHITMQAHNNYYFIMRKIISTCTLYYMYTVHCLTTTILYALYIYMGCMRLLIIIIIVVYYTSYVYISTNAAHAYVIPRDLMK